MATSTGDWLDRFFEAYYRHRPVSATFIGVHEHDDRLPDFSAEGIAAQLVETRALLSEADGPDLAPPADTSEAVDRLLARNYLETQIWELSETDVVLGNPCLYTGEAVFGIVALFLREYRPFEQRVASAIRRLDAVPDLLAQGRANVASAPATWVDKAIDECDGALALLTDGVAILSGHHGGDHTDFLSAAARAADAFRDHRRWLASELAPRAHARYGVGGEAFDRLLRLAHCLDQDGAAVDDYARRRLAEARGLLADGAERIEPGTPPEVLLARLADSHPSTEEYAARYQEEFDRARAYAIERGLLTWPDYPIVFEPIPDWARSAAPHLYFLFYRAPAPFDPHVVQRYLFTPIEPSMPADEQERRLRATNLSQIRLNHVIHHGGIGHHVQNWWAYQGRSRIGRIAAVDCALRIAMLCGGTMAEGWACYVTDLMAEQGYLTPLEELSQHQSLARMAGRAIVDVGLHHGTFSFDEAVAFYRDEIGMPAAASRAEVVKNSMFPGAAMMYLIGTDMIRDLRAALRAGDGDAFDLGHFHDVFLAHGSIPVALSARLLRGERIDAGGQTWMSQAEYGQKPNIVPGD